MAKNVRMADIAQRLGISIVSVSKALSGKEGVGEETRARILQVAAELGYHNKTQPPEKAAGTESIGILVADRFFSDSTFYSNLYRAVVMKCTAAGLSVSLEIVSPEAERSCALPTMLINHKVDGLIFMGEIGRDYLRAVTACKLPYLLLDFYDDTLPADCVLSDNVGGAYALTSHLLQTGRTRIGFVGSVMATSSIMDRYLGYTKALLRAGLAPRRDWRIEDRDPSGHFISLQLPAEMPQAFVCSCDEVAFNLVEKLRREGYEIPRDVAVAGYDDFRFSLICRPQLTTYRVDVESMGAAAVAALSRKMHKKKIAAATGVVPGTFVRRDST